MNAPNGNDSAPNTTVACRPNLARGALSANDVSTPVSKPDTTTVAVSLGERNKSASVPGTTDHIRPLTTPNTRTRKVVLMLVS